MTFASAGLCMLRGSFSGQCDDNAPARILSGCQQGGGQLGLVRGQILRGAADLRKDVLGLAIWQPREARIATNARSRSCLENPCR